MNRFVRSSRVASWLAVACLGMCGWPSFVSADDDGVSVVASASISSPPDRIEMAVSITGSAELAGEAATKFRGQRERFVEAIKSTGIEGITTTGGRMVLSGGGATMRNEYGQVVPNTSATFNVTETVTIDLPATDDALDVAAKIYDLGKDLGVTFVSPSTGRGGLVGAKFLQSEKAQAAAYEQAMTKATEQAATLAKLAGRELGRVVAVKAQPTSTSAGQSHGPAAMQQVIVNGIVDFVPIDGGQAGPMEGSLTQQTTSVTLSVRFELK